MSIVKGEDAKLSALEEIEELEGVQQELSQARHDATIGTVYALVQALNETLENLKPQDITEPLSKLIEAIKPIDFTPIIKSNEKLSSSLQQNQQQVTSLASMIADHNKEILNKITRLMATDASSEYKKMLSDMFALVQKQNSLVIQGMKQADYSKVFSELIASVKRPTEWEFKVVRGSDGRIDKVTTKAK